MNEVHADFDYTYDNDFGVMVQNYSAGKDLSYFWFIDSGRVSTESNPSFVVSDLMDHQLELIAIDDNGCEDSTEKILLPPMFAYIPTSFTPNGDGINDVYTVQVIDPIAFEMTVFDRWGNVVFNTKDPNRGWDGRTLGTNSITFGTYVVEVKASRENNIRIEKTSVVTLLP